MFKRFIDNVFRKPMVMSAIHAHMAAGQFQTALDKVNELIQMDANDGEAYRVRGRIRLNMKDLDGAMSDVSSSMQVDPDPANVAMALTLRGLIQAERGENLLAIADFGRAISTSPAHANDAFTNRGRLYLTLGEYTSAIEDFTTALRFEIHTTVARRAELHRMRATAHLALKDNNNALEDLLKSRAYQPHDTKLNLRVIEILMERGDYQMALVIINDSLKFDSQNAAQYQEAREKAYKSLGLPTPDTPTLSQPGTQPGVHPLNVPQVYAARPQPQEVSLSQRAYERATQGDLTGALEDVDLALRNNPNNTSDLILRGNICLGLNKYDGALASFRRAQAGKDADIVNSGMAGEALTLYMLGDMDDAREIWQKLVTRDAVFGDPEKAQNRLRWADASMKIVRELLD